MAFKITPGMRTTPPSPRQAPLDRGQILRRTLQAAVYWILLQGAFLLFLNQTLAFLTKTRYSSETFPYVKSLGAALLALGYYLYNTLKDPGRQKLLVDTLTLYFLLLVIGGLLSFRYATLLAPEWVYTLVNLGFAVMLLIYRPGGATVALASLTWLPLVKKLAQPSAQPQVPAPAEPQAQPLQEPPHEQPGNL
jgi:hypothetical protein